ncbi:MAG: HNH endonuclease signature motif containing protein [Burkholderiaceae bacterium]|jgi:5-methylcytosine-specific restriction protein A|nr:HNH endonuclease signature motif containing protein [Burkholderiaceae bacterium]
MTWDHKRSRHARGYGRRWELLRVQILSTEPLCRPCSAKGRVTAATAVDHIVPKAKGGRDDPSNLQPICDSCHAAKSAADRGATLRPRIGVDGWRVDE